ncbi:MAG: hypothetical protein WAT19_01275 [Ferruginibacter sp.]
MFKKISYTILYYAYVQIIAFIIFVLTANFYGAHGRGIYASVTTIFTFTATILSLSVGGVIPYFSNIFKGNPKAFLKENFYSLLLMLIILTFICFFVSSSLFLISPSWFGSIDIKYLIAAAMSLPFFVWISTNDFLFAILGEIKRQNFIGFYVKTTYLIGSFLFVFFYKISLLGFIIIYSLFNLVQLGAECFFLLKKVRPQKKIQYNFIKNVLKRAFLLHFVSVASLLNTSFSLIVLNYYSANDLKDVGNLNYANQLAAILMVLPLVANKFMYEETALKGLQESWQAQKKILYYTMCAMVGLCVLAYFLIVPFTNLLKKEFLSAVPVFRWMLLAILPSSFCALMQNQWYSRGDLKNYSVINIVVGLLTAIFSFVAISAWGIYGAVASSMFSFSGLFIFNFLYYLKINKSHLK